MGGLTAAIVARTVEALKLTFANEETVKAAVIAGYNGGEEGEGDPSWTALFYDEAYASSSRIAVFPAVVALFDTEQEADDFITAVFEHFAS